MAEATVTAAIPVRDGEAYLAEAIESVLAQTRPPDQLLVVDNGSSDGSAEIARGYGEVELVSEPRPGIGSARNAVMRAARCQLVAFLDADDLWETGKTEAQLAAFGEDPGLMLVFGHVLQFASPDLEPAAAATLRLPEAPQPGLYIGTMMARRRAIEAVGAWPEDDAVSDGLTFLLRARELGLAERMLPQTVTRRRVHGGNHSLQNADRRGEFARHLKRSLDRRREAPQ